MRATPSKINWSCICRSPENRALNTASRGWRGPRSALGSGSCSTEVGGVFEALLERPTLPLLYSAASTHFALVGEFTGSNVWPGETRAKRQVFFIKPLHYEKGCFQSENEDL